MSAQVDALPQDQASEINDDSPTASITHGSILEAAFVDPGYSWPPAEGQGQNAIELQASNVLLDEIDPSNPLDPNDPNLIYPEPPKIRARRKIVTTTETTTTYRGCLWKCCRSNGEAVVHTHEGDPEVDPKQRAQLKEDYLRKREQIRLNRVERLNQLRQDRFKKQIYDKVPEGILVYRLDTSARTVSLLTGPGSNTDLETLVEEVVVMDASPSEDGSRRGIQILGGDGKFCVLTACDQRTAIAWLEAMNMMLGKRSSKQVQKRLKNKGAGWAGEDLNEEERGAIEQQYLNLAKYSNNLIRTGAIPGRRKNQTGGIYYSIDHDHGTEGEAFDEEALESIAKRRAVIKDSWDFYRMVCSLLRDRRKYDEVFKRLQLDPVYSYLNSMTGLNDPGDDGREGGKDKIIMQQDLPKYAKMTRTEVCQALKDKAESTLPSLVEVCKALAGSLGVEEVGVGPVKEVSSAIRKAEQIYEGDVLKVTDFCCALLVVKDLPTFLALLELARDSFGPLIRRVKISTLKSDHKSLPGGYRDCKINVYLNDHICEIQIHLTPLWAICGVDGFRHYRHCLEYGTDSFNDPFEALAGLDKKTLSEIIVVAEEAVAEMPLDNIEYFHEKFILDYFAEVGLFLKNDCPVWAEVTLRRLIRLRCEAPTIGPNHEETYHLQKYLELSLRMQKGKKKRKEANELADKLESIEIEKKKNERGEISQTSCSALFSSPQEALDLIMDPNKKEREEETTLKSEVKLSKKMWRKIRNDRFKFLDSANDASTAG